MLRATQDADLKQRAIYVMEQAASENGRAAFSLAREYMSGANVPKNFETAVHWLQKSSELNFQLSALWLSQLYMKGVGVKSDPARAQQILHKTLASVSAPQRNEFAWDLATQPDPTLRNGQVAVDLMEQLLASPANRIPPYIDTLAAAYAEVGNYEQAVRTQREAIALAQGSDRHSVPDLYKQHLDSFTHRQPIREAR
jgi:hypothetical protein